MNNIVPKEQEKTELQVQIDKKKAEVTAVLQETILSQLALDLNDKSELATKKKSEVAMFVSKLITTKDTAGRPAIMTCSIDSIRACALTYCNSDVDLYKAGGYLIPYNNTSVLLFCMNFILKMTIIKGQPIRENELSIYQNDTARDGSCPTKRANLIYKR